MRGVLGRVTAILLAAALACAGLSSYDLGPAGGPDAASTSTQKTGMDAPAGSTVSGALSALPTVLPGPDAAMAGFVLAVHASLAPRSVCRPARPHVVPRPASAILRV
jgi:hypothetical protein